MGSVLRAFVVAASLLVIALPAGAVDAGAELPASAYVTPGTYAGTQLVGFTARDAQPLYTEALKQSCTRAAQVDAVLAKAQPSGNGVLLGTTNGATVVAESAWTWEKLKDAAKLLREASSSPECFAYAARDSLSRVYVQYPQLPPLPTVGPVEKQEDDAYVFAGTSSASPQVAGTMALIRSGSEVAQITFRTANQTPDQVAPLRDDILSDAWYRFGSATGAGASDALGQRADELAQSLAALDWYAEYALQPRERSGVPDNPASCAAATDAYTFAGFNGAIRGFAGQNPTTNVALSDEIVVFPKTKDAELFLLGHDDLDTCFADLYQRNLPPGSTVEVERTPKRGTGSLPKGARRIAYSSTLVGPDLTPIGQIDVAAITARNRAALLVAQLASADPTIDVSKELDKLEGDVAAILASK
jgi:hypothetical protein